MARLWALSFAALVVWSRLGVFLHETAGHAFVWRAGGGTVSGIEVSLFGGGMIRIDSEVGGRCPQFLFHMAGILVNSALGLGMGAALVWLLVRDRRGEPARATSGGPLVEHLLAWGALLNLAGATHYTVLGAFYEFGDPAPYPWLWSPALLVLVFATPVTFYLWARTLRPLLVQAGTPGRVVRTTSWTRPGRVPGSSLGVTALVVAAIPLVAYVIGLAIENRVKGTNFRALQAESIAVARAIEEEKARRLREWRAERGDEEPPCEVTEVTEEDIERPFPLTAVVLALDAVFLGAVLFWRRPARPAALPGRADNAPPAEAPMARRLVVDPTAPEEAPRVSWAWPLAAAAVALLICHALL